MMKRILPILLIAFVLAISAYSYFNEDKVVMESIKTEEELNDDEIPFADVRIAENPRITSNYEVKDLDKVLKFIDPYEMQNYDDLLTLYAVYLPMILDSKAEEFYEINKEDIKQLLGIYDLEDYMSFYERVTSSGITKNSLTDHIEVLDIVKEGNLLKSTVRIVYDSTHFDTTHYLNYLYIEKESYLYLYTLSEVL